MRTSRLYFIAILFIIFSVRLCYAEKSVSSNDIKVWQINKISKNNLLGDPIISNKNFIDKTNKNCNFPSYENEKENKCELIKLENYYGTVFESIGHQKVDLNEDRDYQYYISKQSLGENEQRITLFIENNSKVIDSLKLYSEKVSETAAVSQYYYIDGQFRSIWITQILADETNRRVDYWKHYQIDDEKHFKLLESISCKYDMGDISTAICTYD